ncbi:hypothetical protein GIB67_009626 [Kingdonia uniflora]|uniref:Short-chain dehydrogenase/reductase n=1 Tax=Kingdonia uniflora TaxID=39325 RepID=A0A7J7M2C6_9MAGN|nr:hypothetical protein GIB67_009626 [Kingdonia uniflora]
MAETNTLSATKRCAVVTGANKGIGLEICRQLASNGVFVVLTARNEKRGIEALENLKENGLSDVVFHQLDLINPTSIASLADFIDAQFGKLDILVNNAAVNGTIINDDVLKSQTHHHPKPWLRLTGAMTQSYELAEECLKANYYGTKGVTEALLPFLKLSSSARIVNVSSKLGQLENIPNEWAKVVLSDVDELTEERIDEVVTRFLKDYKDGLLESKDWPTSLSGYTISKAALNAYTRILAKKFPTFCVNSVTPGFVKTDMSASIGVLSVEEGADNPVRIALMPDGGPSGFFFARKEVVPF